MISTITLLIDHEQVLLNEFIKMASQYDSHKGLSDLADEIQQWFENWIEDEVITINVGACVHQDYQQPIQHVYQSILSATIANISEQDWLAIAHHYMTKATKAN